MTWPVLGPGVWFLRAGEVQSITPIPCETGGAQGDLEREGPLRLAVTRYPVSTEASESGRQPIDNLTSPWHCKLFQLPGCVLGDLCKAHACCSLLTRLASVCCGLAANRKASACFLFCASCTEMWDPATLCCSDRRVRFPPLMQCGGRWRRHLLLCAQQQACM